MDVWTDSELVLAVRAGDKAAFGVLIDRYQLMVIRIAYRTVRHEEIARDLAQEALLQAYLSLNDLRSPDRFRSWLYGLTLNLCRYYLRSQHWNTFSLELMLGGVHRDDEPTPEDLAERLELRRAVTSAVEGLSPANRAAVLLFYYEGFSLQEAADLLGIRRTALKGRLHKARQQLRTQLQPILQVTEEPIMTELIPVKIVDVISREVNTDGGKPYMLGQIVLHDETQHRAVVIWISESEAMNIFFELSGFPFQRPNTPQFVEQLLTASGATINEVRVNAFQNNVFYATVVVNTEGGVREVDARPSDALGLAVRLKVPIFVSADVFEQAGIVVPESVAPIAGGMAAIHQKIEEMNQVRSEHSERLNHKRIEHRQRDQEEERLAILQTTFGVHD